MDLAPILLLGLVGLLALHERFAARIPHAQPPDGVSVEEQLNRAIAPAKPTAGGIPRGPGATISARHSNGSRYCRKRRNPRRQFEAAHQTEIKDEKQHGQRQRLERLVAPQGHQCAERSGRQPRAGEDEQDAQHLAETDAAEEQEQTSTGTAAASRKPSWSRLPVSLPRTIS